MLIKYNSNFSIEALDEIYRRHFNSNYFNFNRSASLFRRSSTNQIFCKLSNI